MADAISFSESELSKRVRLADVVPLEKPFTIQFDVSSVCNLKCEFCPIHGSAQKMVVKKQTRFFDFEQFTKCIDDIKDSFGCVKQILFTGSGEPLLNPRIVDMIKYISDSKTAERITVITNGLLLTNELSDKLIDSGLSLLRVSVNGLSSQDYKHYTGTDMDFEKYVDRLRYFYEHKNSTQVYIKIMNYMVDSDEQKKQFYDTFSSICDIINVENVYDMGGNGKFDNIDKSQLNQAIFSDIQSEPLICSIQFYTFYINSELDIYPCCEGMLKNCIYKPLENLKNSGIKSIWNKTMRDFQYKMIDGKPKFEYCKQCTFSLALSKREDLLDDDSEEIKERYDKLLMKG